MEAEDRTRMSVGRGEREREDDEARPPEMADWEEAQARARERSHDPHASEIGTAATAERREKLAELSAAEHERDEEELGEFGHRNLDGPVHDHDLNTRDRDLDASSLPLNDPEVRSTYERYLRGQDMDGERRNYQPPGW
ncbi:MAG TPA: hypothetical protein VKZ41_04860 [Gemmatimonadales bacterium]|nr:hypothetical protein [Gemmatimonadales bacterium]